VANTISTISFGSFELDLSRGELTRAGHFVSLAPKPLALLLHLAANRDRAVPKQELRRYVWPDVFVSEAALASALKDLRRALGDDGAHQKVVRTLRRRGYRFVAQPERPHTREPRSTETILCRLRLPREAYESALDVAAASQLPLQQILLGAIREFVDSQRPHGGLRQGTGATG